MRTIALAALLLLTACSDPVAPVHGDLSTFDGTWGRGAHCTGLAGGRCDLPSWYLDSDVAVVSMAVVTWGDTAGHSFAVHRGTVLDGCLSVDAGVDDGLARDAYDLCPTASDPDMPDVPVIAGAITWGRGTIGECSCDTTLRLWP